MDAVRPLVEAVFAYLKEHPQELLRAVRNALALRFGVPLAALRWIAERNQGARAPRDLKIVAIPPGVRLGAGFELMNTPLRASADIFVERVNMGPEELRVEIRLANVQLEVEDLTVESPLAALLRSGALDLSKPGNLVAYMPKRPPILVEAKDDRIVLDFLRHRKIASNGRIKRWIGRIVPLVTVAAVQTDDQHLDVAFQAFPEGVGQAFERVRRAF